MEGREVREAGVGKGVRRKLGVKTKVTIYSMGLLALGACFNYLSEAMKALPEILKERDGFCNLIFLGKLSKTF